MAVWTAILWAGDIEDDDFVVDAQTNLIVQYQEKPRVEATLQDLAQEAKNIDAVAVEMLTLRSVLTAEGVNLDVVGDIVQQERGELTDDEYRLFILGKILVNKSDGKLQDAEDGDQLYDILDRIGVAVEGIWAREYYPAGLKVTVRGVPNEDATWALVQKWKPGGVDFRFCTSPQTLANTFKFSASATAETTGQTDTGFANPAGTTGGHLVAEYRK